MRIKTLKIENFRGFKEEFIDIESYTCFVGPNGSGKSTVLTALNVFFRQYTDSNGNSKLKADDFHHRNTQVPITITLTFVDLSDAAKVDLADYVRDGKLIVAAVATYDASTEFATVRQVGWRLGIPELAPWFKAESDNKKVADLITIYEEIRKYLPALKEARTKPKMLEQLREYEDEHKADLKLLQSEDQFYGTRGSSKLSPYLQWIFVPALKNVAEEADERKSSALGLLLGRTIRTKVDFTQRVTELRTALTNEYRDMIEAQQSVLEELSVSLQIKLQDWAHPGASAKVMWKVDPERSISVEEPLAFMQVGERGYEGELFRFGHGMQRSCMLTLLHELATTAGATVPSLVMGIEEPELFQHPPQSRYLSEVLQSLAKSGSQILTCSHSPLFIPGDDVEAVRVVREVQSPSNSTVSRLTYAELAKQLEECGDRLYRPTGLLAKLMTTLSPTINEMFFCRTLVLVESMEDVAYLSTYLELEAQMTDFRRCGCHIVPVGKKSEMLRPVLIAMHDFLR